VLPGERAFKEALVNARDEKGVVNDSTIKALAKNARADYLCLASINTLFDGKKRIVLDLLDLKSEPMKYVGNGRTDAILLENSDQFTKDIKKAVDEMLEGYISFTKQEPEAPNITHTPIYQNFTKAERFGTFVLNHAVGLGSYMIMDNTEAFGWILGLQATGTLLYFLGTNIFQMPDRSDYDAKECIEDHSPSQFWIKECEKEAKQKYKDDRFSVVSGKYALIISGFGFFGIAEIVNLASSFGYDKPKTTSSAIPRNFNLAILPTRNGNGMAYGLMYNRRF